MKGKENRTNLAKLLPGLGLGLAAGWTVAQQAWTLGRLARIDVRRALQNHQNQAARGVRNLPGSKTDAYSVAHTIEDGIERIVYTPKERRFQTPILMHHGMWHGAWCWQTWQEALAKWGWESVAISQPGHGLSPEQRPVKLCTLDYYLGFLAEQVARLPRKPVLMGHSMGGALTQWYLKYVGDDLPAAVLVAPWVPHAVIVDGGPRFFRLDFAGCMLMMLDWSATPLMRSPESAARALLSPDSVLTPEEFQSRLGPESALVMYQHNPPLWYPPQRVQTPMLWLAGEKDAVVGEAAERRSAAYYQADYHVLRGAAHNLMMEANHGEIARYIHDWLISQGIE